MSTDLPNSVSGGSTTTDQVRRWTPEELVGQLRRIFETKDLDGLREMVAPWVVLRSPYLTPKLMTFRGRDEVCLSMWCSFSLTEDFTVTEELLGERTAGLSFHYRQGGRVTHGVVLCHLDDEGRAEVLSIILQGLVPVARFGVAFARRVVLPRHIADYVLVDAVSGLGLVVSWLVDFLACWFFKRRVPHNSPRVMSLPRKFPLPSR